jgi:hypothetical protein
VRSAVRIHRVSRLDAALSALTAEIRVACAASMTLARASPASVADLARADDTAKAADALVSAARSLISDCRLSFEHLAARFPGRAARILAALASTVGESSAVPGPAPPASLPCASGPPVRFEHSVHLALASVACGWDTAFARSAWASLSEGHYSADGKTFLPRIASTLNGPAQGPLVHFRVARPAEEGTIVVSLLDGVVHAVTASRRLRVSPKAASGASWAGLSSLPSFIALPRDEDGRPIIPRSMVTTLVEHQEAWHTELGSIDAATSAITRGLLVMPKVAVPSQQQVLRNHPSWEDDPAARAALGPIIAKWLAQGVLEYVEWDDRQPVLLQPCGAVPKGTAPFYRLITDARYGNRMYSDWGVSYTSAADLSHVLHRCDFSWSADLEDAYHLAVFHGCGGPLRPVKRPVVSGSGEVTWIDGFINGCDTASCRGGCDKDMSGICIDGHVFRFAACQFGQKTAGSPLNSLVMSVARYFARLPTPVHVAAWVDDLHFSMSTPPHPPCEGMEGGCAICVEFYGHALRAQALWRRKAAALGLPLSPSKGHEVAQRGAFCGVMNDALAGLRTMLPEKLVTCMSVFTALLSVSSSSPRELARARGKAGHYSCALAFLHLVPGALSQAMHQTESCVRGSTPSFREESAARFDWDAVVPVSIRCRAAIAFGLRVLASCAPAGQPLWPVPASSLFGAFSSGRASASCSVVISLAADQAGWRMALRSSPHATPVRASGQWSTMLLACRAPWMAPLPPGDSPDYTIALHAFAAVAALLAAQGPLLPAGTTIIFRSSCAEALSSLCHGDFRRPAVQDAALLLGAACLDLRLSFPVFLPFPPPPSVFVLGRPGSDPDDTDESSPSLRKLLFALARGQGSEISLDVFASERSALVPRFFSAEPSSAAEGTDAFCQPSWGFTRCQGCGLLHSEFVALTPPHDRVAEALRKAKCDEAVGVMVVPYQCTAPWWPLAMGASTTPSRSTAAFAPCLKRSCRGHLLNQSGSFLPSIAILTFDFRSTDSPPTFPPCHSAPTRRTLMPWPNPHDLDDA